VSYIIRGVRIKKKVVIIKKRVAIAADAKLRPFVFFAVSKTVENGFWSKYVR